MIYEGNPIDLESLMSKHQCLASTSMISMSNVICGNQLRESPIRAKESVGSPRR